MKKSTISGVSRGLKNNGISSNASLYTSLSTEINGFVTNNNISGPSWNLIKDSLKNYADAFDELKSVGGKISSTLSTILDDVLKYFEENKLDDVDLDSKDELDQKIVELKKLRSELEEKRDHPYKAVFNDDIGGYEYVYDASIVSNCNMQINGINRTINEIQKTLNIINKVLGYINEINNKLAASGIDELITNLETKYSNI